MKPKKPAKKRNPPLLKTDLSFEELIEGAFNDKVFKKDLVEPAVMLLLNQNLEQAVKKAKKSVKKSTKKAAPKKRAAKKKSSKKVAKKSK